MTLRALSFCRNENDAVAYFRICTILRYTHVSFTIHIQGGRLVLSVDSPCMQICRSVPILWRAILGLTVSAASVIAGCADSQCAESIRARRAEVEAKARERREGEQRKAEEQKRRHEERKE